MRKQFHFRPVALIASLVLFCVSCQEHPEALFTSDTISISAGESVQFTDESLSEPITWAWTFEGGAPAVSTVQNPLVTYNNVGTYSVTLEATNRGGTGIISRDNYITVVKPSTDITFNNNTFKPISITVDYIEKTIPVEGSVTYYDLEGTSIDYYAETSGTTTTGTIVGELLTWNYSIELTGGSLEWNLNISSDYYFMTIANSGTHVLTPLEVTQGLSDVLTEYISIPNNGTKYNIGYYKAYSGTVVKGYFEDDPGRWVFWENLTFAGTINQSKELTSSIKKGIGSGDGFISNGKVIYEMTPATNYKPTTILKEGTGVHFPNNPPD